MKNLKTVVILSLAVLAALASARAFAQDELFPNNTGSRVVGRLPNTGFNSGIVEIRTGYFYRHLYGYNLMLEVMVVNKAYRKEIRIHEVDGQGRILRTQATPVLDGQPMYRPAAPFARYLGKSANVFDRFQLAAHAGAARGRFIVEVRMDGVSYWSGYLSIDSSSHL